MSLGLTKPGMPAATRFYPAKHSLAGQPIEPLGYLKDGTAVWPQFGAAADDEDPDDPTFTGSGGGDDDDTDDEDDEDDEDEEPRRKKRPAKKSTKAKAKDDEDEDDEDEDEDKLTRPERQAARYRTRLRAKEKEVEALNSRLKALEDKDKKPDEIATRDLEEERTKRTKLEDRTRQLTLENAFFKANQVDWIDPADALRLVDLEDVDVDEDGTVDAVQLRKALRALAKQKPHLVKKAKASGSADDQDDTDEDDTDDEPRSRQSASTMNWQRRGSKGKAPSRQELAKKFPVLNRL